nr:HEAT repeat domain-containing protein [Clostridium aestuarii]
MNANVSSHIILPVARALTTTGGGRYNVIEEAVKEEVISDFRLIPLLIKGLDDKYGEIGQLIYDKLKDVNNSEFLPLLQESFDRQGKKGDAFRLSLIAQILGEDIREFCIDLLEDSSKDIKVEAVNILGNLNDTENILLEQVKSKSKDVRKAAYCGLVKINSHEVRKELEKAIKKTDYDIVLSAIECSNEENYTDILLVGLKDSYEKLTKKQSEKGIQKIVDILYEIKEHKSKEVFEFLVKCLEDDKIDNWEIKGYYYTTFQSCVVKCIAEYEDFSEKDRDIIESKKENQNYSDFDLVFKISLKSRTQEEIYEIYSPYFINRRIKKEMVNKTMRIFSEYLGCDPTNWKVGRDIWYRNLTQGDIENVLQPVYKDFDKRWIDIFKKYKIYYMLSYTLNENDTSTVEFMVNSMKKYEKLNKYNRENFGEFSDDLMGILTGMVKIGYEEAYEVILKYVKATIGDNLKFDKILLLIPYLPSSYIDEIQKYILELKNMDTSVDNAYLERGIKNIERVLTRLEKN